VIPEADRFASLNPDATKYAHEKVMGFAALNPSYENWRARGMKLETP